jgi:hypothetical protein
MTSTGFFRALQRHAERRSRRRPRWLEQMRPRRTPAGMQAPRMAFWRVSLAFATAAPEDPSTGDVDADAISHRVYAQLPRAVTATSQGNDVKRRCGSLAGRNEISNSEHATRSRRSAFQPHFEKPPHTRARIVGNRRVGRYRFKGNLANDTTSECPVLPWRSRSSPPCSGSSHQRPMGKHLNVRTSGVRGPRAPRGLRRSSSAAAPAPTRGCHPLSSTRRCS